MSENLLSPYQTYLFCVLGIFLSVILPILRQALPKPSGGAAGVNALLPRLWRIAEPYLALSLFSLLAPILIIAFAGDKISSPGDAILFGYAFDSTLQKLKG
jgi:hypothetical protein